MLSNFWLYLFHFQATFLTETQWLRSDGCRGTLAAAQSAVVQKGWGGDCPDTLPLHGPSPETAILIWTATSLWCTLPICCNGGPRPLWQEGLGFCWCFFGLSFGAGWDHWAEAAVRTALANVTRGCHKAGPYRLGDHIQYRSQNQKTQ